MNEFLQPLLGGLNVLTNPMIWVYIFVGNIIGVIVGALPGVGTTQAYGLVLPFTFVMDPVNAISFLMGITVGNQFGNSIPAILIGLPGSSSAILTTLEGFQMQKRGEGALALGVTFVASLGGQFISILMFIALVVPLMGAAYVFMQPEQFALYLFGLVAISSITGKNVIKGLMSAAFGVAIGLVGTDPVNLNQRFTFGLRVLRTGFEPTTVMIGLLAVSELFRSARQAFNYVTASGAEGKSKIRFPAFSKWRRTIPFMLFGTIVGTLVGAVPGAGATPSTMASYQWAQFFSKHPEEFGHGSIDGIAANEAAQNASNCGELIPTLGLGIPGSGSMVFLLGALTVHGFIPGPMMLRQAPHLFNAAIGSLLGSTIFLFVTGWFMCSLMLKAVSINRQAVIMFALGTVVIGVFSAQQRAFDILVALVAGGIGYLMMGYGYSTAAAALGVVLGAGLEKNLRLGLNLVDGNFIKFFSRPITGSIAALTLIVIAYGVYRTVQLRKKMTMAEQKT
jgi:putative tricarboxylic transport membrane protein